MLGLTLNLGRRRAPTFLFLGAHSDDIEIGCGGTVTELLRQFPDCSIHWVVLSAGSAARVKEAKSAARSFLRNAKRATVVVKDFRGAFFPSEHTRIKEYFEELKQSIDPDVIFAHNRDDLHQDHRVVGELVWNTFRNHMILEYEIPKYDGDMGTPSVFVPLSGSSMRRKVSTLMRVFKTQHAKQWFTASTFEALMRLRGIECNAASGFAEAFYCRKLAFVSENRK